MTTGILYAQVKLKSTTTITAIMQNTGLQLIKHCRNVWLHQALLNITWDYLSV